MTPEKNEQHAEHTEQSLATAIYELGAAWADVGLEQAEVALESTSKALARTAQALVVIRERFTAPLPPQPETKPNDDPKVHDAEIVPPAA